MHVLRLELTVNDHDEHRSAREETQLVCDGRADCAACSVMRLVFKPVGLPNSRLIWRSHASTAICTIVDSRYGRLCHTRLIQGVRSSHVGACQVR